MASTFRVGFALDEKKVGTFLTQSLLSEAAGRGLEIVLLAAPLRSPMSPIVDEGHFDAIVHKLFGDEWTSLLNDYKRINPEVIVIDPPENTAKLRDRQLMLDCVRAVPNAPDSGISLAVPDQIVVSDESELMDAEQSIKFPAVAKPMVAQGGEGSHSMWLVYNRTGLRHLSLPCVLQQFVNHGGVLFKVYVLGAYCQCVLRTSLPDVSQDEAQCHPEGLQPFAKVSNKPINEETLNSRMQDTVNATSKGSNHRRPVQKPPVPFVEYVSNSLRQQLGLQLFNYDLIMDINSDKRYFVIDINYFPGYAKMPGYENAFCDFLQDLAQKIKQVIGGRL